MTADITHPRVTIAIPLHRSAPFVDVVTANIQRIIGDDVEILVSDRTLCDDALEVLRRRHGSDPRITFLRGADNLGWIDHDNALLRRARGEYFMWMPHDDDFPADYLPLLRAALDAHPDALLAFGSIEPIGLDGAATEVAYLPPLPIAVGTLPRHHEAIVLLERWNLGILFRGLMRREDILRRRLTVRHTRGDVAADAAWGLAVVAAGPVAFEPSCVCRKRYYPSSTHAQWPRRTARHELEVPIVAARYLVAARVPPGDAARIVRHVAIRSVQRALWLSPSRLRARTPRAVRHAVGRRLARTVQRGSTPTPAPDVSPTA